MSNQDCIPVDEEFRDIPGFPAYRIGNKGTPLSCRVYGSRKRRLGAWWVMKQKTDSQGYPYVDLFVDVGTPIRWRTHWLVLTAFVGPRPEGLVGRHLNDVRTDNRLENLAWGTEVENQADALRNKIRKVGEESYQAKLTNAEVLEIRQWAALGLSNKELASQFGLTVQYVWRINTREIWRHV